MRHRSVIQSVFTIAILVIAGLMACSTENPRERSSFNAGWKFSLAGNDDARNGDFDDTGWRLLDLPHDWSIEEAFNGKCLLVVKAGAEAGNISVTASSEGLTAATAAIRVR